MSQREIVGIDYACGKDWSESLNVQIASALGLSEEFLSGSPTVSTSHDTILNMRAHYDDPAYIAAREARTKKFSDYMMDVQYRVFLHWAPRTVTRRGVSLSVMVPKVEVKTFRSLRTAKVWNKRRIKENAKRV